MSDTTSEELLDRLRTRLEIEPGLVSHDLARWRVLVGGPEPFGEERTRHRLALCRSPRRGASFAADVAAVAAHAEVGVRELARFYRLLDAEEALRGASSSTAEGVLAAARDLTEDEATQVDAPGTGAAIAAGALPGWLAHAVDWFWRSEPPPPFPRDLELHILLHLPVAVVEAPNLTVEDVRAHLGPEAAEPLASLPNRRVHACLLAYAGVGIIYVDATDDDGERRVNLAHETSHFVVDYLLARERLASHDPGLLDVMDGLRAPTRQEELGALLAGVPLGVQTHLLERDAAGGHLTRSTTTVEDRAETMAWELLAPRAEVLAAAPSRDAAQLAAVIVDRFGFPDGVAAAYAAFLARLAAPRGDSWLNLDD